MQLYAGGWALGQWNFLPFSPHWYSVKHGKWLWKVPQPLGACLGAHKVLLVSNCSKCHYSTKGCPPLQPTFCVGKSGDFHHFLNKTKFSHIKYNCCLPLGPTLHASEGGYLLL